MQTRHEDCESVRSRYPKQIRLLAKRNTKRPTQHCSLFLVVPSAIWHRRSAHGSLTEHEISVKRICRCRRTTQRFAVFVKICINSFSWESVFRTLHPALYLNGVAGLVSGCVTLVFTDTQYMLIHNSYSTFASLYSLLSLALISVALQRVAANTAKSAHFPMYTRCKRIQLAHSCNIFILFEASCRKAHTTLVHS